jgi:mono/diheme cytochrome c family protein
MTQVTSFRARGVRRATGFFFGVSVVTAMACSSNPAPTTNPSPNNMPGASGAGAPPAAAASTGNLRSSTTGVYSAAQATEGRDLFASQCASCHSAISLVSNPDFKTQWVGKPLWNLVAFVKREMPTSNPGSLTDAQYSQTIAFLLQTYRQPAGSVALPTDSVTLKQIRLDTAGTRNSPRPR